MKSQRVAILKRTICAEGPKTMFFKVDARTLHGLAFGGYRTCVNPNGYMGTKIDVDTNRALELVRTQWSRQLSDDKKAQLKKLAELWSRKIDLFDVALPETEKHAKKVLLYTRKHTIRTAMQLILPDMEALPGFLQREARLRPTSPEPDALDEDVSKLGPIASSSKSDPEATPSTFGYGSSHHLDGDMCKYLAGCSEARLCGGASRAKY